MNQCQHIDTLSFNGRQNCTQCSTFICTKTPVRAMQHNIMKRKLDIPPALLYDNLVKQQNKKKVYHHRKEYAEFRKEAIIWLKELTDKLSLSLTTFYTSVAIMDYVLNQHNFPTSKFQVIALVSLIISTKYDELDRNIPMLDDYIRVGKFMYPIELVSDIEALVLKILDYDLKLPHSLTFLELYLSQGVVFNNDSLQPMSGDGRLADISKYAYYYNLIMLQDNQFSKYDYSKVALTAIIMSRKSLGIDPIWNDALTEMTTYRWEEISTCINVFMSKYEYLIQNALAKSEEFGSSPTKSLPKELVKQSKSVVKPYDSSYDDKLLLYDDMMNPTNVLMDKDFNAAPYGKPCTMSDTKKGGNMLPMPMVPKNNMNHMIPQGKKPVNQMMKVQNSFKENEYAH